MSMELLKDMFSRGNWGDIAWFVVGAWLFVLFFAVFFGRFLKKNKKS
jgi:hypothetical protein